MAKFWGFYGSNWEYMRLGSSSPLILQTLETQWNLVSVEINGNFAIWVRISFLLTKTFSLLWTVVNNQKEQGLCEVRHYLDILKELSVKYHKLSSWKRQTSVFTPVKTQQDLVTSLGSIWNVLHWVLEILTKIGKNLVIN